MSSDNKEKKPEDQKEGQKEVPAPKKVKEVQKDAEVLKLLEEDEDDFEEFEEGGTCDTMQLMSLTPPRRWMPNSGEKIGTTKTLMTSSRNNSKENSILPDLHVALYNQSIV
jgi:glucose dehydrogenase